MAENETNGNDKVEYESISLYLFPEWEGNRILRDVRVKALAKKFECSLPAPALSDTEGWKKYYAVDEAAVAKAALRQISYDKDRDLRNFIEERLEAGEDPTDLASNAAEIFQTSLSTPKAERVRGGAAKVTKEKAAKADATASSLGVSPDEMFAVLAYMKENPSATMPEAIEAVREAIEEA